MVEINNLTDYSLPITELQQLAEKVLENEKRDLSVAFLDSKKIAVLNKRYRKKNGPTDVLSFEGSNDFLGEVLISPEIVKSQAKENELDYNDELRRVLVHGILHLLGFDHQKKDDKNKMFGRENEILFG